MLSFTTEAIAERLDGLDDQELDELDFGVVRMTHDGVVIAYNRAESRVSGMQPENVKGRNFFVQVAPCTNNYLVAERYRQDDELDEVLDYVFTYAIVPTPVTLRLVKRAESSWCYLLVRLRGGGA